MELMFLGADHEVTGSCHYLQVGKKKFLVDCGMEQGIDRFENADMPVPASEIDFVFLTHAHIDHSGMLPKLYRDGFRGQIISTRATASLCNIMLKDSAHIQEMEAQWRNKKAKRKIDGEGYEPIYTMEDAVETIKLFVEYPYGKIFTVCDGIRFRFTDVGHLLGSASIELWLTEGNTEKKIVFSGDIGNKMQPLLKDPEYTAEADYVVMESTYGDRIHEKDDEDVVQDLADIISETFHRGGNVVIPAFAIGRTQVMLYYIRHIKEKNMVPDFPNFPVYVDSPLAVEATQIFYECGQECYDDEALDLLAKDINPIGFPNLHLSITTDDSKAINFIEEPKVIISASGMCDAGRIKHHLKYNLWREDSTILMVGYQSEGSPGRKIQDGAKEIKIFGEDVAVRAKIQTLPGLSGHADRLGLLEWIEAFKYKPRQVFVVHGEDQVAELFSKTLSEECGIRSAAPYSGTRYDLAAGKFILITSGIPISKATAGRMVSSSFTKLKFTGRRILDFINGCQGLPNKDLERFSQDLEALIEKYRVDQKK
ncbi:MAG: MBL fold metallo-hydrolase [Lachnospiraceae bacterium]|jgi:metallo-beta-lactamase family protein|nr:MBL fold metallo-hydrolase [Lachnospiraceae bacterium]